LSIHHNFIDAQGLFPDHHSGIISRRMLVRARNIEKTIYETMEYWQILSNETFTHTNWQIFGNETPRKN
jgi:hypothetical protein